MRVMVTVPLADEVIVGVRQPFQKTLGLVETEGGSTLTFRR